MRVLITNDDGYDADGIKALVQELNKLTDWEIWVVAPDRERSATSMSLSIIGDLNMFAQNQEYHYVMDGYPADCVNAALHINFFPKFDLVLSGINQGPNLGDDVHYSGTVAGARQAALKNIKAVAVSAPVRSHEKLSGMLPAACFATDWLIKHFTELKAGIVYNINYPEFKENQTLPESLKHYYTRQGRRTYHDHYEALTITNTHYKVKMLDTKFGFVKAEGTDFEAVLGGHISITPLSTYTTDTEELQRWQKKN